MVAVFETIGGKRRFRILTEATGAGGTSLRYVPGLEFIGTGLLPCTMIRTVHADSFSFGLSPGPAFAPGLPSG